MLSRFVGGGSLGCVFLSLAVVAVKQILPLRGRMTTKMCHGRRSGSCAFGEG